MVSAVQSASAGTAARSEAAPPPEAKAQFDSVVASQRGGADALQGTTPANPSASNGTLPLDKVPLDRPPAGASQRPSATTTPNELRPDDPVGRDVTITTRIPADSPVLPGGRLVTIIRNPDPTAENGTVGAPRLDIRAFDAEGNARGAVRIDRASGAVSGAISLGDGRQDLVFGGSVTPGNDAATSLSIAGFSGNLGLRLTVQNPFGSETPNGTPGAQGGRAELIATPGGNLVPAGNDLRKPLEMYVFAQSSNTPGSLAGSEAIGAGIRVNAISNVSIGDTPVTGSANIEVSQQESTNRQGVTTEGTAVTVNADLTIGRSGQTQGILQGGVTLPAQGDPTWQVYGGVTVPLP